MGAIPGGTLVPLVKLGKRPEDCWRWLGPVSASGYGNKTFNGKSVNAKRWLWMQLFGPLPAELVVSSRCGDELCMNPHHFVAQTQGQANRAGASAQLLPGDVVEIRRERPKQDMPHGNKSLLAERLASRYRVSRSTVFDIWGLKSWRNPHQPLVLPPGVARLSSNGYPVQESA